MSVDGKNGEVIAMEPIGTPTGATGDVAAAENAFVIKSTRTRRLFSGGQLFAFSLVSFGTWIGIAGNIYFAMQNGGPRGWLFGYILVCFGTFTQLVSLGEMASIQPIAGAQYYWTYSFAPESMKKFLTWIQGWATWLGYIAFLASIANNFAITTNGLISLGYEDAGIMWIPQGWQTMLICWAYVSVFTFVNLYAFWIVPWFEVAAGALNVLLFFTTLVVIWAMAPRNDLSIFLEKSNGSGWGDFESFNIGTLSSIFLFVAFECTVHMGEETRNPQRAVPMSMFWGVVSNMAMGLIMVFTYGIALPPVDDILNSVSPFVAILRYATGSNKAALTITALTMVSSSASLLGMLSSVSRLSWAWARDGGLPKYFAIVDAKTRVPERAVWGTAFLICLLTLLNLNNQAFIALGAIMSLNSLAVYVSYVILLACIINVRYTAPDRLKAPWSAGPVFGWFCNVFALIYSIYIIIWLPFPNVLPVEAANMNYSGPLFIAVMIFAVSYWFLWAKKHWAGPNMKVVEIVLKHDEESKN